MKFSNYLKNKNLSKHTIYLYLKHSNNFLDYCKNKKITLTLFCNFLNEYSKKHNPNSTRVVYYSIIQYLKFIKCKWINQIKYKLPKIEEFPKPIVDIKLVNKKLELLSNSFYDQRTKLLVKLLIYTGIRCCEVKTISKKSILNNKIKIVGKGNKLRYVFINEEIKNLISNWKYNYFCVNKKGKLISDKQLRSIIKKFGKSLNTYIYPHMLRRTFCTELIKKGCNLKVVQKLMGHSNIAITSRYIQLSEDEMFNEYCKAF